MPDADELTKEGESFRYEPLYCFNGHHLWEIFPGDATAAEGGSLNKYFNARQKKVNMRKVRLRS